MLVHLGLNVSNRGGILSKAKDVKLSGIFMVSSSENLRDDHDWTLVIQRLFSERKIPGKPGNL